MIIELTRKLVATDASIDVCAVCGNDFELGSVYAVATSDHNEEMESLCPTCLEYLNRRMGDAEDPTGANWPARGWPPTEALEEARRRHPKPMFATPEALLAGPVASVNRPTALSKASPAPPPPTCPPSSPMAEENSAHPGMLSLIRPPRKRKCPRRRPRRVLVLPNG